MTLSQPNLFGTKDADSRRGTEGDQLFREVVSFPPFDEIVNGELFSLGLSNKTTGLTHGMHRFPAKYIPQIPGWVMNQIAESDDVVLDPFCGSGTTLVEGLLRPGRTVGIDCDPLACMISRAKTTVVDPARIQRLGRELRHTWRTPATLLIPPMPDLANFGHWFSRDAWGKLQSLLAATRALDASAEELNFLLCVFSSILRRVSNADDQTQKTYVSGTLKKNPPEVEGIFYRTLEKAVGGLEELTLLRCPSAEAIAIQGDATDIRLPPQSVDLIVTSPPYLDSVDYMYNFMLEYFWLGPLLGVQDRRTFNQMRRGMTGAKNPDRKNLPSLPQSLQGLISEAEITPHRIAATRAYWDSMAQHFHSAARTLKRGGYYFLVIGNSQTRKGVLPIHDCLVRLAANSGFTFEKAFGYRIRRHYMKFPRAGRGGIITMDWVIALRNMHKFSAYPPRLPLPDFTLRHDEVAN